MSFTLEYSMYIRQFTWLTLIVIAAFLLLTWVILWDDKRYTLEDANAHAEEFGGVIAEAHGPVTLFIWISYAFLIIWSLVYLWVHWMEFRLA